MKTSSIRFEFSRIPLDDSPAHGFDLGDLTLTIGAEAATSIGATTRLAMMIYLSIADLVLGIVALVEGSKRTYEFVGVDSSFVLVFSAQRENLQVTYRRKLLGVASFADTLSALSLAIDEFLSAGNQVPPTDAAQSDLSLAIGRMKLAQAKIPLEHS